jgi:hypothetical protein
VGFLEEQEMSKEEIIEFAEKAGLLWAVFDCDEVLVWEAETKHLQRFADLVAKNEREGCILELERNADKTLEDIVAAIRARGQA